MTFSKNRKLRVRYRDAPLGAAKLFAVQLGAEQLVEPTCGCGTTGCGYNWVSYSLERLHNRMRHHLGAALTGRDRAAHMGAASEYDYN
jgi:hypothetical protein